MRLVKTIALCALIATVCGAVVVHEIVRQGAPVKRLRGTVTDWTGAPILDTQVEVYDNPQVWDDSLSLVQRRSRQKKIASTVTDDKGRYNIRGVRAGRYEVQFSRGGGGWNILSVLLNVDRHGAEGLCVELRMESGAGRGQIKDCK